MLTDTSFYFILFYFHSSGLREAAALIEHETMQTLADELKVDTKPMMIPYDGNIAAELGYRLVASAYLIQ